MKFVLFFALSCLGLSQALLQPEKNQNGYVESYEMKEICSFDMLKTLNNQTQFMDLNVDCKLLILERVNIFTLINLVDTNKELRQLAEDVYRRRFASKLIIFPIPQFPIDDTTKYHVFEETDKFVRIKHFPTAMSLLRNFGHLILSMEIEHFYVPVKMDELYRAINVYCSETLTQLEVSNVAGSDFEAFDKPFKKVENVILSFGRFRKLGNQNYTFAELFPEVRHLTLGAIHVNDMNWIDIPFPHLHNLSIYLQGNMETYFTEPQVIQLLKANPNIRQLRVKKISSNLLENIAKELPMLESLHLERYYELEDDTAEIRFDNMKSFMIEQSSQSAPSNVHMGHLEE